LGQKVGQVNATYGVLLLKGRQQVALQYSDSIRPAQPIPNTRQRLFHD